MDGGVAPRVDVGDVSGEVEELRRFVVRGALVSWRCLDGERNADVREVGARVWSDPDCVLVTSPALEKGLVEEVVSVANKEVGIALGEALVRPYAPRNGTLGSWRRGRWDVFEGVDLEGA